MPKFKHMSFWFEVTYISGQTIQYTAQRIKT